MKANKRRPSILMRLTASMMSALILLANPAIISASAETTNASAQPPVRAQKTVARAKSAAERAKEAKAISVPVKVPADPSDLEMTALRIFPEPLVPMTSKPAREDNKELASALRQFVARKKY